MLRVACLNLGRAALIAFPKDMVQPQYQETLYDAVKLFFNSLTSQPMMVVEAAHAALAQV